MTIITLRNDDLFHRIIGESVGGTRIARIHGLDSFSMVSKDERCVDCSVTRIRYFLHRKPRGQEVRGLLGTTDQIRSFE